MERFLLNKNTLSIKMKILIALVFLFSPILMFSTHVVGGSLTYVYNGGSNYTITLKLYRDCGPGTAALPGSVTIQIRDVNGNAFSPSKNVTIPLTSVTNIAASLDPCAIPPNPSPCVEEAIYTTTVNNLPPNATGYHMYFQICCRNGSILNIVNPGSAGETFYANIPGSSFVPNSDPVFNLFPPLFICVNKPFTFNHSATDADGDSLVYSLYQPYNNTAPTFPGGVATFPTVTYVGGYSSTNPLGAGPFNINSSTGLLSGTPNTLGQFVVGVKVKEYRNGVYIGETIRDFQFNVVNCPQPPPTLAVPNATINNGCSAQPTATGITSVSATWNSIFPGAPGTYNNYLSCTSGCLSNTITQVGTPPPFVDYVVCGISTSCSGAAICDTFRVYFNPSLAVSIFPSNPTLCFGQTSTTITAIGSGGTPPYSYLWNNVNPSQTINVGVGTYNIQLSDASGCPPVYSAVSVTAFTSAITANAGPNQSVCIQNPITTLTGTVTGASGGIWSGGGGTFLPNNTTLSNVSYSPTPSELAAGSSTLYLTTTGNGTCPLKIDTVIINYVGFTGVITPSVNNVGCFGGNDGSANINLSGGFAPYTYLWNTVPSQTTSSISNLSIGIYSVTIQDAIGCSTQTTVNVSQPPALALNQTIKNVSCPGTSTGSISVNPVGGTAPYTYSWLPGGQITSSITALMAGNYSVTVTDAKGCIKTATFTITQPSPIFITYIQNNATCFNLSNGSVNTTVNGGTAPFTFSWSPGGATSQNVTGLHAGTYTLTVKDNFNCTVNNIINITQPPALTAVSSVTNETCNYLNNGSAFISPAGGTGPYTYTWSPGNQNTQNITNQTSGTYTVLIKDSKGCNISKVITITEPPPLNLNFINPINVSCFGGNNGSVSASPSGGTPNYTYSWTPSGSTSSMLSNASSGTYTVIVKDSKLCSITNTITLNQPTAITATQTTTNITCNGLSNGAITINTSGGTSPYSYSWLPLGQTTSSITNIPAGIYTVNITDSKGCIKTSTYSIIQPNPLVSAISQTNVSCFGGNNGAVNSNVSGGTAPYTYTWNPGGINTPNLSVLVASTKTLTLKDNNNCITTVTVSISQPPLLTIASSFTNETCDYLNNGVASLSVTGGSSPYSYLWSPGSFTASVASNLSAGVYTANVTDNNGCIKTKTISISQPNPININFINQVNVSCFGGNNGYIGTSITGGSPNYSYTWTPGNAHTTSLMNLAAGIYTVNVKDSKNCTSQNTVSITQPSLALSASILSQSATCYALANGSATVSGIGGTPSYNYTWTPGNIIGSSASNLSAGTYSVKIIDSKGCLTTKTLSISQPSQILPVVTSTNSTCGNANGIGSVSVTGGIGPYTYQWSPAGGTFSVSTGLLAGPYTVLITDFNGCQATQSFNINDLGGPVATIFSTSNVSCYGGNNGSATVGVSGGVPPITYSWSPSGGTGATATGLTAGIYYVTVTDANGCISLATTSPEITEPPAISSIITTSNVSCFGGANGSATVTAAGGNPSYTYTWLPSSTNGSSISNLSSNTYSVLIEDQNNCILTSTFTISQAATPISISATTTSVTCNGGSDGTIDAYASGGTAPYYYNWFPGNYFGHAISNISAATYSVNVTDANGCIETQTITVTEATPIILSTGSINSNCSLANGQVSVTASGGTGAYTYSWSPSGGTLSIENNLLAGTYIIEVIDANNCTASSIQILADNPSPTVSIAQTSTVSCFGGSDASLAANVLGGTGPFTYTWSPTGGNNQIASNLSSNSYSVIVTAANGCTVSASSPVIPQPSLLFSVISTSNVSCFSGNNGSASIMGGGGNGPYSYTWLPSSATGSITNGLSAGNYSVQINDANNCQLISTYTIFQPNAALSAIASSTAVSCFGGSNGIALVNISGGTIPYNYNWQPMSVNSNSIGGLSTGTYSVDITDFNNCITSATVFVNQPTQALTATVNSVPTSCSGGSDGTATVTATGGTGSYSYQWSPSGGTNPAASGLGPGTYFIDIFDANNCSTNISVIVSSPTPVTGSLTILNPACGQSNGVITSQISGGTGPYTYSWSPVAATTSSIGGLLPGAYSLTTLDSYNCSFTQTTTLVNLSGPILNLVSTINDSCFGSNDGAATIGINSGTAPYNTSWLPFGGNNTTANQLTAGTYTANVTDSRGCISFITATITEPNPISLITNSIVNVSCFGGNNGSISISASGGTPNYSYTWLPTGNGANINNLSAGSYTVNITDSHFCTTSSILSISEPSIALSSFISSITHPLCHNSTGNASCNAIGGTLPYTYTWTSTPPQNGSIATNIPSGNYTVYISDGNGCLASNTVSLVQPSEIYTNAGANDTICIGLQATLTSTATGGVGNYYYVWQPVNVTNSGTLTTSPTSNSNYTVVAFDQNGCAGIPDTAKVIVYNLTAPNIQTFGISPLCPGQSSLLSASINGNTGPITYNWSNGVGPGIGPHIVTPTQPTTYYVTVSNNCGTSILDSVVIKFNPPPTVSAAFAGTIVCVPGSLNFLDNSLTGNSNDPISYWLWDFGDGSTSTQQNPSHNYTTAGTYSITLTVTTDAGCTNNSSSSPIVIDAYPYPIAQFSVNTTVLNLPYDVLNCTNQSTGASSYNWNFGDGGTSTVTNPNHTYTSVGPYDVQLIATTIHGCSDTAIIRIITDADIVYPNVFTPSSDGPSGGYYIPGNLDNDIFFPYTSGVIEYKFQVFDRWGELIFETEDIKQGWDGYYKDKLCQQGVYIWKAYAKLNNGKEFKKTGDVTLLR